MSTIRPALALCLLGATGCTETWALPDDAGDAPFDAGIVADRGVAQDVGLPADVGAPRDSGFDAGVARDLGAPADDGAPRDLGAPVDNGVARDVGTPVDRPIPVDIPGCIYEAVVIDSMGDPRNAAGHVRECWPGETFCFCDADNDCYAQAGYAARCAPGAADAGTRIDVPVAVDTGPRVDAPVVIDTGPPRDTGTVPGNDPIAYSGSFSSGSGRSNATITVSGRTPRSVVVYAPSSRGASPPLIVLFHGTGDRSDVMFSESRAQSVADANGVVIVAPQALDNRPSDWDHLDSQGVWWLTYPNVDPTTNEDLLLTRALIVEARRRYNVDASRVYAIGHSNGAFFATLVASALADRIAGYGTSSGGLIRCASRESCTATASGTSCANLSAAPSQCRCTGVEKPVAIRTDGLMPPGYFAHATDDDIVSPYYTCALATRMTAVGATFRTVLRTGDGHSLPPEFLGNAWSYLSAFRR
jgi:poly(3-hydroxybutyrate) depolymerase